MNSVGTNPLGYLGVQANNPPNVIVAQRSPTTNDLNFAIGTLWIDQPNSDSYQLTDVSGAVAYWTLLGNSSSSTVQVAQGGTGDTSLTDHGVLVGSGTDPVTVLSVGATGTVLAGATGADPAFTASPSVTTLTATTVNATTLTTNVAAAQLSLNATTIAATGSDTNVSLNLTAKGSGSLVFSQSKAAIDQNMQITNSDNTAAASSAGLQIAVGGSTSLGDPYVRFEVSGVAASTMTMGLDNSDSDIFKISNSTALGTSDALTLTQAGALGATTSVTAGTTLTATLGAITATDGDLVLNTAGNGVNIKEGSNARLGVVDLTTGSAVVSTTEVTANSRIFLSIQVLGTVGAPMPIGVTARTPATSFTITSSDGTDTSTIAWMIVEPA